MQTSAVAEVLIMIADVTASNAESEATANDIVGVKERRAKVARSYSATPVGHQWGESSMVKTPRRLAYNGLANGELDVASETTVLVSSCLLASSGHTAFVRYLASGRVRVAKQRFSMNSARNGHTAATHAIATPASSNVNGSFLAFELHQTGVADPS